jgi:hypothetical protein
LLHHADREVVVKKLLPLSTALKVQTLDYTREVPDLI